MSNRHTMRENNNEDISFDILLEDPLKVPPPGYRDHDDNDHDDDAPEQKAPSADALKRERRKKKDSDYTAVRSSISTEKIGSILKYLDDVESKEPDAAADSHQHRSTSSNREVEVRANKFYKDIKTKLAAMTVELDDKKETIDLLKKARKQDKKAFEEQLEEQERDSKKALARQEEEFEEYLRKQLDRMDSLMQDKEELTSKCSNLTERLQELEAQMEKTLEDCNKQFKKKLRDVHEGYKVKKKAWKEEWEIQVKKNNHKILAKSLQEQITLHLEKQKQDLAKVRSAAEQEKGLLKNQLNKAHEDDIQRLKASYESKTERLIEETRDEFHTRLDAATAEKEKQLNLQQERLERESERARDVLFMELKRTKEVHEDEISRLKKSFEKSANASATQAARALEAAERRNRDEMQKFRDSSTVESEAFIRTTRRELERESEMEIERAEIRLKKERDEEIEMIRTKLDERYRDKLKKELAASDARTSKSSREYEAQLELAANAERAWQARHTELAKRLDDIQNEQEEGASNRRALEEKLKSARDVIQDLSLKLDEERQQSENRVHKTKEDSEKERGKMLNKQTDLQFTIQELEQELSEIEKKHTNATSKLKKEHHDTLQQLDIRVRKTIAKKEDSIMTLQDELNLVEAKYEQSQTMLEQSRRELLSK